MLSPNVVLRAVYLIDDDAAVRRSLTAMLFSAGLSCTSFCSGVDFLNRYEDVGPACIVTDVRMPDMCGLELLKRMRRQGIAHPAIVMTGYGDVKTVISAFHHGIVDFFEKPVSGSLLLGSIQEAIENDILARERRMQQRTVADRLTTLTDRERTVLKRLVEGLANKQIAWQLNLSEKTVAAHRAHLLIKMGCPSLPKLIVDLARGGLLAELRDPVAG